MAAGAVERQAQEHLAGGGDDIVQVFIELLHRVHRFVLPEAQAVEAGGDDVFGSGRFQLVARQLLQDEAVVGLVLAEGADDIVAVAPDQGLGAVPLVAVGLGVADQVEPVPGPALAILGRGQQPLHHPGKGAGGGVGQEGLHLGRTGRQSGQVVVGAAQQRPLPGRGRGFQPCRFQPGQNEGVDGSPDPALPLDPRDLGPPGRLKGPEMAALLHPGRASVLLPRGGDRLLPLLLRPGQALRHPPVQQGHLLRRQRPSGRHLGAGVVDGPDQEAGFRILEIDRGTPPAALQNSGPAGQTQPGLDGGLTAVAAKAAGLQDGPDLILEEGRLRFGFRLLRPHPLGPGGRQQRHHPQGPARQ